MPMGLNNFVRQLVCVHVSLYFVVNLQFGNTHLQPSEFFSGI